MTRCNNEVAPDYAHTLSYNPSFDGIRAIAVLGVIFAHFGVPLFSGGGQGVDVFFVLSGYLISRVLLQETRFSAGIFYWHRFIRLAPALLFLCIGYLIVGWYFLDHSQVTGDVATSITYISNWTRAFGSGYPQYLGQTWSLSIEEQFYIIMPFLLFGIRRCFDTRISIALMLSAAVACVIYRTVALQNGISYDRIYNGLDTHCDGLLCGVTLGVIEVDAIFLRERRFLSRGSLIFIVTILLMFSLVQWDAVVSVLINIATMCLITSFGLNRGSIVARVLSLPLMVRIGQMSYSLYLWHYPIFLFLFYHLRLQHAYQVVIGIPLSFSMAILSHRFVEKPALRMRDRLELSIQRWLGLLSVSLNVVLIIVGSSIYLKDNIIDLVDPAPFHIEAYGPKSSVKGQGFNVQPNGESIIWAKTSAKLPHGTTAKWHNIELKFSSSSRGLYLVAPADLISNVGSNVITIESDGAVIASFNIEITE